MRNTPEYIAWEKKCQPAKEKLENASEQLRKEVDVLGKRGIFPSWKDTGRIFRRY